MRTSHALPYLNLPSLVRAILILERSPFRAMVPGLQLEDGPRNRGGLAPQPLESNMRVWASWSFSLSQLHLAGIGS